MPLTLFVVLGCIQLFVLLQAKLMAQYAIYQAARMGSVSNGRCDIMLHAAILSFSPALRSLFSPQLGGSAGARMATVFNEFKNNDYNTFGNAAGGSWNGDSIVWIVREQPRFPGTNLNQARNRWDSPLTGGNPVRLELRAIFWSPLRIPFADWVFSRMALAHLGLQPYRAVNPLAPTQTAGWARDTVFSLDNPIAAEYLRRVNARHYVYPIEVTYTMRMMSPVMVSDFNLSQNCARTPGSL